MPQILFFATKEDLVPLLEAVEHTVSIKYVRMGWSPGPEFDTYARGSEIPNLGQASSESSISSDAYLVTLKERPVKTQSVRGLDRAQRYLLDQLGNPGSITFTPGGLWGNDVVLYGRVGTASEDSESQVLMKRFQSQIRKSFRKIKAYWVGPHAEALLDAGKRLTIAEQSPRDFDLTRAE